MQVRVEISGNRDFLDPLGGEKFVELAADHVHADVNHGLGVLGCGLHAHFEVVDDGEQFLQQALVGIADGFLALAGGAFAEIVHFRCGAQGEFLPFGDVGFELLPWIEGGGILSGRGFGVFYRSFGGLGRIVVGLHGG